MKKIHFIGIGGAGMAPLAQLALHSGVTVSGSDTSLSAKSEHLKALGAEVFYGHNKEHLSSDTELVVYSSAVTEKNPERQRAAELGIPQLRRGEFLGIFAKRFKRVAAVSGSHGKSSITAMLCTILESCGCEPGALIGAARIKGESALSGNGDIFVTEVDESDGTHICVVPFLGIVPNIDEDHEWSVGGAEALKENFRTFGRNSARLLIADTPELRSFYAGHPNVITAPQPDNFAGFHGFMAKNAALAVEAAVQLGVPRDDAVEAVRSFSGIERRMQLLCKKEGNIYLEDYAHHPSEVRSSIELVRQLYPGKELLVVFQPHRYARLERFFAGFCSALDLADRVIVTPVFAAWCESGSVDGAALARRLERGIYTDAPWSEIAAELQKLDGGKVILILGAGDISELTGLLRDH
ncbi:MAG: hypothetical protein IKD44_12340 [Lentisphaeria bacterium]|nr:hypothetical protein [Lentisphaeria bacterium]